MLKSSIASTFDRQFSSWHDMQAKIGPYLWGI